MLPETIPVFPLTTPAFRPMELIPLEAEGQTVLVVRDPLGVADPNLILSAHPLLLVLLEMADGQTSVAEMSTVISEAAGQPVPAELLASMVQQLDEACLLQSERFRDAYQKKREDFMSSPVRPSSAMRLPGDRLEALGELGREFRRHRQGPKAPPETLDLPRGSVVAALVPHIDYNRGGHAYAWAYKALQEYGTGAGTWVILATAHRPLAHRFVATRKSFETPFGVVETDTKLLDRIASKFTGELFADEYAHAAEHTVEMQAVYMKQVFGESAPRIVPILVGSFDEFLEDGRSPLDDPEIAEFCSVLRSILEESGDAVSLVGSVDLSHCGAQFGDPEENDDNRAAEISGCDRTVLSRIESGDPDKFLDAFRESLNSQKVCSIAPIYCVLQTMKELARPRLLTYDFHNSEDKTCLVSFCSVAFLKKPSIILAR